MKNESKLKTNKRADVDDDEHWFTIFELNFNSTVTRGKIPKHNKQTASQLNRLIKVIMEDSNVLRRFKRIVTIVRDYLTIIQTGFE